MIAMALAGDPELLVADEPTTALDVTIQAQILELMRGLQAELGMAIVLITHDLGIVAEMADRVAVMYAGQIVEETDTRTLFRDPKHPYTQGLIGSVPVIGDRRERLEVIPGRVPNLIGLPHHCRFAPRCKAREELGLTQCTEAMPALVEVEPGHKVRCFIHSDGRGAGVRGAGGGEGQGSGVTSASVDPVDQSSRSSRSTRSVARPARLGAGAGEGVPGTQSARSVRSPEGCGPSTGSISTSTPARRSAGRRVGLRQDHARPDAAAAARARPRAASTFDGRDLLAAKGAAAAGAAPGDADRLPGSVLVARPAGDRRRQHRRGAAGPGHAGRRAPRAGGRGAGAGRARAVPRPALSPPVLRGPAPADRHRPGAGRGAAVPRRRRAGVGARRLDPVADPEPAARPPTASSTSRWCSWPTTWPWSSTCATGSR